MIKKNAMLLYLQNIRTYDDEKMLYRIRMPERDKKTKSFGNTVSGFEFKIRKEEFDSTFDGIIKTMLDNLEKYQS